MENEFQKWLPTSFLGIGSLALMKGRKRGGIRPDDRPKVTRGFRGRRDPKRGQ